MASRITRILPFLVITLCCVGAVELGYSLLEYRLFRQQVAEEAAPGTPAAQEGSRAAGVGHDPGIILRRNLFGQQIKANEVPPAPAEEVPANLDKNDQDIVLVGTIGGSAGTHRAIILDKKTRRQDLYKEGDEIQGASIKEISRGKVILDVQGREELLDMAEAASVRPPVQVPPQTPPREPAQQGGPAPGQGQPEQGPESSASGVGQVAPEPQPEPEPGPGAGEGVEPPPAETPPEIVEPPQVSPETAPPAEEPQPPQRRIVRPRVVRP